MAVYQPRRAAIATILVLSSLFQLHPDRKKCSTNMTAPRTHLLGCISNYHSTSRCLCFRFFGFSHILAFSITVVRIFVQVIALLFFTGRWQCGSHIALSPPWLPPLTEKLSCTIIRSVKRKKTIMSNLNMSKLHDSW